MKKYKLPDNLKHLLLFSQAIPIKLRLLIAVESNTKYSNHLTNVQEMHNFYVLRQTPARIYIGTDEHNILKEKLKRVINSLEKWMKLNGEDLDINVHGFCFSENSFTLLCNADSTEFIGFIEHLK